MAQAPATPKPRRLILRMAATLGGPALATRLGAQRSERAALALRSVGIKSSRPPAEVVFLIPLVAPEQVGDWDSVTARLRTTLDSFLAQTDARWRALICCQIAPPLPDDPRISHLPFADPTPGNDKWRKLDALVAAQGRQDRVAYVMPFDADDLLHRDAVAGMLARAAPCGYLVHRGLVMDHATGTVALADRPSVGTPLRKPFWKLCGSCAAIAHDPAQHESTAFLRAMVAHEHRMFPHLAALAGLRLAPMAGASVLYVLNHGENFGVRRGRVRFKTRFVERFRLAPSAAAAALEGFPGP
jgi:hypothetical protein